MNEAARPKRHKRSVYVRRRIAVLTALLVLAIVIVMVVAGPSGVAGWFAGASADTSNTPSSEGSSGAGATGSGANAAESRTSSTGAGQSGETSSPNDDQSRDDDKPGDDEPTEPEISECSPNVIAVEAVTNQSDYAADEQPKFSLRVSNHGSVKCDIDLGTKTMAFTVRSGQEQYWDSRDCQVNAEPFEVRMEPNQTIESTPFAWERVRSDPETCDDERDSVPAGGASYHLDAEIGGVQSMNSRQFILY